MRLLAVLDHPDTKCILICNRRVNFILHSHCLTIDLENIVLLYVPSAIEIKVQLFVKID